MPESVSLGPVGIGPKSNAPVSWWCRTPVLTAVIFAAILLNNEQFVFRSLNYETNDVAANSLQIFQAKQFHNVLGHFCRFGFYHPGPAFFYVYAVGEALFFDALHLVPTPFNAQFIALYALSAFFFGATLSRICSWLGSGERKWFLGLALLFAAWHFGSAGRFNGRQGFFDIWPPCVLTLPFLCFLVTGASVASGKGKDLPLMTLAGCFLVHGYVCLPFFVVPLTLLVYGSLVHTCRNSRSTPVVWPWVAFPREHLVGAAIIILFLIPIMIDVITVNPSNIRLIVDHIRTSYGEGKSLTSSILYFLHYGAYAPRPRPNTITALGPFDFQETLGFFRTHWRAYGLWLVTLIAPIFFLKGAARRGGKVGNDQSASTETRAFLGRLYMILGAAVALTIWWGCILEGPMFYYISTFNFAIYYGFALILAITAADWLEGRVMVSGSTSLSSHWEWRKWVRRAGPILILLGVVGAFWQKANGFRSAVPDQEQQRLFSNTIERALKADSKQPKLLSFEGQTWAETLGLALYLERRGCSWYVVDYAPSISLMFGADRAIPEKEIGARISNPSLWRIVSSQQGTLLEKEEGLLVLPLAPEVALAITPEVLRHGPRESRNIKESRSAVTQESQATALLSRGGSYFQILDQ